MEKNKSNFKEREEHRIARFVLSFVLFIVKLVADQILAFFNLFSLNAII